MDLVWSSPEERRAELSRRELSGEMIEVSQIDARRSVRVEPHSAVVPRRLLYRATAPACAPVDNSAVNAVGSSRARPVARRRTIIDGPSPARAEQEGNEAQGPAMRRANQGGRSQHLC